VKNLKVAWTVHLGGVEGGGIWTHGGLEGTPIVENGFMYVTDGWGSVYKIDAHGGQGILLWKMDPKTDHDWAGAVACCGVDNRGVALWGNLIISHALDGRLIATNKENGQVAWQRQVADPDKGEVIWWRPDEEYLYSVDPPALYSNRHVGTAHRDKIDTGISVDTRSPNWRQTHDQGYSCQPVLRDIARCRFELRLIGCGSIRRTHRGDRLCVPGSGCWRWLAG
jgi:glucose dehydrogenase